MTTKQRRYWGWVKSIKLYHHGTKTLSLVLDQENVRKLASLLTKAASQLEKEAYSTGDPSLLTKKIEIKGVFEERTDGTHTITVTSPM